MKYYKPLIFLFILVVSSAFAQDASQQPQINISGSADVKVTPDQVNIRVGVETRNENLDQARSQHDERMRSALQFLKTMHVPSKDVQTDFISVAPEYDNFYNNSSSHAKPVVYIIRKSIEINLTNIAIFEPVMTGLLTNGVTDVHGVEFRTSHLRKYRDEARSKAIEAAREKADALCAALGAKRGKPLSINASEFGGFWTYGNSWNNPGFSYASNAQVVVQNADNASDPASGTVSIGQISVSATVNVSFAIE